ncbi:MAG: M14 metallopeptidase family protein [Congregibacter sp.]
MKLPAPARLLITTILASTALIVTVPNRAIASEAIPTPKSILGDDIAADYFLADYNDSIGYFQALESASERLKLFTAGKTTQGQEIVYSVISSPENLVDLEKYKAISRRLGSANNLNDEQARQLARDSKIIVHIDGGLHSTEVAAHQLPIALAHKLLAAVDDAEVETILNDVILVLWPTLNPDGQNMVVDWYRTQRGTPYETSRMPWLYQEYVGHDNNRDGYMINMLESQAINRAQQDIAPVIWYTHHQTAPFPARIWMPPFADPVSSNINSLVRTWTSVIGMNMMARFETEGKTGAIAQGRFDNWYPGFVDYTHAFRNTISFFTEVAHDSATPKEYRLEDFPANKQDLKGLIMSPSPWRGGLWRLRDSVDYMVTASMSVLETASKYRETLLYNRYQAARDTITHYAENGPFAYVVPAGQSDMPEAALLVQKLLDHGLTVHQASRAITVGKQQHPAGSWVVLMDQPYAGLARELFGVQKFPDALLDGEGNPARVPYDVTGWTLPLQMGVSVSRIDDALDTEVREALTPVSETEFASGRILGDGDVFVMSRKTNASFRAVNDVLSQGGTVSLAPASIETINGAEPNAFIVGHVERSSLQGILEQHQIDAIGLSKAPAAVSLSRARIGIYRPWGGNQYDEGWTRWLLEQYGFEPRSVYNTDVKAGELAERYDTIIIPDLAASRPLAKPDLDARVDALDMPEPYRRKGSLGVLLDGLSPLEVPDPYAGGIGDDGGEALSKFVWEGGTIVALNKASEAIIDLLQLPVTNVLRGLNSSEFSCAGALLQVELRDAAMATGGMPERPIVMFGGGPAFQTKAAFEGKVLASFADDDTLLQSGVIIGPEKIQGKGAALEVSYGQGKVYLFGFKPQWRGQSHGTYKMLFNLLYQYEKLPAELTTASTLR